MLAWAGLVVGLGMVYGTGGQSLPSGLVVYYPFNGNAKDQTGSGIDGVVQNAALVADRFGHTNAAYAFNGVDSQITFTSYPLSAYCCFSVSAWLKPASLNQVSTAVIVGQDSNLDWAMVGFSLGMAGGSNAPGAHVFGILSTNPWRWVDSGFAFPAQDQWYHVVATFDESLSFFVNGVRTSGGVPCCVYPRTTAGFRIGSASGFRFFNGSIDDVRIYDRALGADEIKELYQYESQPCTLRGATAAATVVNGFVVRIDVTEFGCGYTNVPTVQILGGGGSGATAIAQVSNGMVTGITVTDAGVGYTNTPTVWIGSPPLLPSVLSIVASAVRVTMQVWPGNNYVLESSTDSQTWTQAEPQFTAQTNLITQEFEIDATGRFFRIRQVP